MIKNPSLQFGQTSIIYDKQCPVCGRFNLKDASICWNCHHHFINESEKTKSLFTGGEKTLFGLMIVLISVVVLLRYLVG